MQNILSVVDWPTTLVKLYLYHELNHHTYFPNGSPNAYIFDCCNEHQMNDGFSKPNKIANFAVARNHSIAYFRVTIFKNISVTSLAPKRSEIR